MLFKNVVFYARTNCLNGRIGDHKLETTSPMTALEWVVEHHAVSRVQIGRKQYACNEEILTAFSQAIDTGMPLRLAKMGLKEIDNVRD